MMRGIGFGPRGPVRLDGTTGEYVRLAMTTLDQAARARQLGVDVDTTSIQQMVNQLVREYDPGGYLLHCPVAGCRWTLDVPRMELDPEPLDAGAGHWVTHVEAVPREDVELVLRTHLDWHAALCETDARDVPLPVEPPA